MSDTSETLPIIRLAQGRTERDDSDIAAEVTATAIILVLLILFVVGCVVVRNWP